MLKRITRNTIATVALAATTAITATTIAPTDAHADRIRQQVPIAFPSKLTALGDTLPYVAEALAAMSDKDIDFRVAEPGKIVKGTEIFDAVSSGKVKIGYSWMGYEQGKVPAAPLFGAVPFGLEPQEYIAWYYFHGGKELVEETFSPHNVHPVFCGVISPEAAGWFTFPLDDLSKMQGLKFRAAGLGGKIMSKMGASVTVLPGGELYQALEKGVLDATEFSLPTVDDQLGFYKVAQYYHLPGWHQPSTSQYLYVNKEFWDETVTAQQKAMIETACTAGVTMAIAKAEALQGAVIKDFQSKGVELVKISDEILQQLHAAAMEVFEEEATADESGQFRKVLDSMMAFKAEHAVWKEYGYLPRDWKPAE
ncbi:MAG: TRAP transporter substrate-binding protein [Alphaproteobacteria bacterium]